MRRRAATRWISSGPTGGYSHEIWLRPHCDRRRCGGFRLRQARGRPRQKSGVDREKQARRRVHQLRLYTEQNAHPVSQRGVFMQGASMALRPPSLFRDGHGPCALNSKKYSTVTGPEGVRAAGHPRALQGTPLSGQPHAGRVRARRSPRSGLSSARDHPFIPPIDGIDTVPFLTNDNVWDLDRLPSSMLILGGGPIGTELAQAFTRLGTTTTIVEMGEQIHDQGRQGPP